MEVTSAEVPDLKYPRRRHWDATERPCPRCGTVFTPRRGNQKYCAPSCRRPFDPRTCEWCGGEFEPTRSTTRYCSLRCREFAKAERYREHALARFGGELPAGVRAAYETKVHFARRGGYALGARVPSRKTRAAVIARDKGRCRECGAPGTEVDHLNSGSGGLEGLQLLCRPCHDAKTLPILDFFMADEPGDFGMVARGARSRPDNQDVERAEN